MKFFFAKLLAFLLPIALLLSSCTIVINSGSNESSVVSNNDALSESFESSETSETEESTEISNASEATESSKVIENEESRAEEKPNDANSVGPQKSEKQKVIDMFMKYGDYLDGEYYIREYDTVQSCTFLYTFCYSPEYDLFLCSVLVTTHASIAMYDYGSVTFSWNDFDNALFSGYHELENIASIKFEFSPLKQQSNMTYRSYNYDVVSNNYQNLTDEDDIDEYADVCFDCINQSLMYAQSILNKYTSKITLW